METHFLTIYKHTGGVPGWLCLVAELGNRSALGELPPQRLMILHHIYVEDCLSKLEGGGSG